MNEERKAARESSEASWKSLEESLAAVERGVTKVGDLGCGVGYYK